MDSGGKQAGHGQEGPSRCPNSYQINSIDVSVLTALDVSILILGHHAPPSTMVKHWRLRLCKLAVGRRQHVSVFPIRRAGAGDMVVNVNVGSILPMAHAGFTQYVVLLAVSWAAVQILEE